MSKPPGRPKSEDPKLSLPIRVRSSILAGFADTNAARAAIEALVEARFSPGLRKELARALDMEPPGTRRIDLTAALDEAIVAILAPTIAAMSDRKIEPGEAATIGSRRVTNVSGSAIHVHVGPIRPRPGEMAKKPKGTK